MEPMNSANIDKQYGINKIFRFCKSKSSRVYIAEKKEILKVEKKEQATVVKMEFTNNNCFLLLSDGRVLSRGKGDCLGRPVNSEGNSKMFHEVLFNKSDGEADNDKSAIIYNISAGDDHVLALDYHYRVWGWGYNDYLQIDPKGSNSVIKKPILINLPMNAKVAQIFALQRSSMVVCKNNIIYMWGSISEGFLGDMVKDKSENCVAEFIPMDKISAFIINDINKNDENYTEVFINSRKLFNTKYNKTLEDNMHKANRIEKLNTQINNLKADIEMRLKQNRDKISSFNQISADKSDKKIVLLQELLMAYESKISKISNKKENLRKKLISIEEEINQKNIDLNAATEQIDVVEDKMESYNNEITELKSNLTQDDEKNTKIVKNINEKNKHLYNLKIYKESLMNNLQVIIMFLEEKEKERKGYADEISRQTDKENQYLKARYTVEDMIMILIESFSGHSGMMFEHSGKSDSHDKFKSKYIELFEFSDNLEKITFSELNKVYPYKIIDDIIKLSNTELKKISKSLEITKSTLSEVVKENLKILFEMVETKMELIKEQNHMIKNMYHIFTNLEKEIKMHFVNDNNFYKSDEDHAEKNNINSHVEYVYKKLIVKFFEDAYRGGKGKMKPPSIEEKERLTIEQNAYLKEKQRHIYRLEERNKMYQDVEDNYNLEDVVTFGYGKGENKSNSMFEWGIK